MTLGVRLRTLALPAVAVTLIGSMLGVQVAHGGGGFSPVRPADPCSVRAVSTVSTGIDGLTERLVLLGLDSAACRLRISREALVLRLAEPAERTDAEIDALRAGLLQAVDLQKADGSLPAASDLVNEALDRSSLNGFIKAAIRALPDSVVDKALETGDVLKRTINDLDIRKLLANLNDPDDLASQITGAVTNAVEQSLLDRLRNLL